MTISRERAALFYTVTLMVSLSLFAARAGEVLVDQKFESFDVAKMPAGWGTMKAATLSIVEDAGKGKVLRVNHAGGGEAGVAVFLDIAKVRGNTVRAAVSARCPNSYTPVPEKNGYPQLLIMYKDAAGNPKGTIAPVQPNSTNWQELAATYPIPNDAASVLVACRVLECAADVYFDELTIDVLAAPGVAQQIPLGTPPSAATDPKKATLPANAAQVPTKALDDDGITFNAEIYAAALKARKPGTAASTIAIVGPGLPITELDMKAPPRWNALATSKEVAGVPPERLSVTLPAYIVKNKPEIVIIVGETKPGRKLSMDERSEWEDLAKICARFGAVPILAIPTAGTPGDLRKEMLEAAELAHCSVLELRAPMDKRMQKLFGLFEKYVFERTPPPTEGKPTEE